MALLLLPFPPPPTSPLAAGRLPQFLGIESIWPARSHCAASFSLIHPGRRFSGFDLEPTEAGLPTTTTCAAPRARRRRHARQVNYLAGRRLGGGRALEASEAGATTAQLSRGMYCCYAHVIYYSQLLLPVHAPSSRFLPQILPRIFVQIAALFILAVDQADPCGCIYIIYAYIHTTR